MIFKSVFLSQTYTKLNIGQEDCLCGTTFSSPRLGNLNTGAELSSQTTNIQKADSWQLPGLADRQHKGQLQKQLLIQLSGCKISAGHCPDLRKSCR